MSEDAVLKRVLQTMSPDEDVILRLPNGGILAQGNAASALKQHARYDLIVLCAEELQRKVRSVHPSPTRARLVYAPNDDATLTGQQLHTAFQAAQLTQIALQMGRKVLVTCMQGRNRSGLVSALTLHLLLNVSGARAREIVQRRRIKAVALTNDSFNSMLDRIPPYQQTTRVDLPTISM